MDFFGDAISAGALVLQFLGACAAFNEDAKSLKARFAWDLEAIKAVREYFETAEGKRTTGELSPQDVELLERTSDYLGDLLIKVRSKLVKLERRGWLRKTVNQSMWINREKEFKELEREVFDWTQRFNVRILGLPTEIRTTLPTTTGETQATQPEILKSSDRILALTRLAENEKEARIRQMLLEDTDDVVSEIARTEELDSFPLQLGDKQLIFSSRTVALGVLPGTARFIRTSFDAGALAAALHCLDATAGVHLLRVEYYFYHAERHQFFFAHTPPYPVKALMTLEEMITFDEFPEALATLDQRLRLAKNLTEAVFFLHTAGFLHKNITASSILALTPSNCADEAASSPIDSVYLMGFNLIRGVDNPTSKEGTSQGNMPLESIWHFDIYQHPDRHRGQDSQKYINTYDVYSLGVVLLEVGLWQPLQSVVSCLNKDEPTTWPRVLMEVARKLGPRMGMRYQNLVFWCLGLKGGQFVDEKEFKHMLLDTLEAMCDAMSFNSQ